MHLGLHNQHHFLLQVNISALLVRCIRETMGLTTCVVLLVFMSCITAKLRFYYRFREVSIININSHNTGINRLRVFTALSCGQNSYLKFFLSPTLTLQYSILKFFFGHYLDYFVPSRTCDATAAFAFFFFFLLFFNIPYC